MADVSKKTHQQMAWAGDWGNEYVDRNPLTIEEYEQLYIKDYAVTRDEINREFLGDLPRDISILEVGANVGVQLEFLTRLGFHNVRGIEINEYAVAEAKKRRPTIEIIHGSGFTLPFRDGEFDLVFTSGVLIHISPKDVGGFMREMCRVTKKYIWGFEYYAPSYVEIQYRGYADLLWKTDFAKEFMMQCPGLRLAKEKKYPLTDGKNETQMFWLKKI